MSKTISFYPGPSKVYEEVPRYVRDAWQAGILSINHRSEEFIRMSRDTVKLLHRKLNIPSSYTIFFTGSATECWEIIAQSLITDRSLHFHNGAFGQKWFDYTSRLQPGARSIPFEVNEFPDFTPAANADSQTVICITQNETSNGTHIPNRQLQLLRKTAPEALITVDATSSMGGIALDFKAADVWFASVQKCFGLPAGLALLVCSPRAVNRFSSIGEKAHYNSLTFMKDMMDKWQTPFTPNVLGIYLLMRVMEKAEAIKTVEARLKEQYAQWVKFMAERRSLTHFVENPEVQSWTVVPVKCSPDVLQRVKKDAKKNGLLLGEGYGPFKAATFRIANFPALKKSEIRTLKQFLLRY